MQDIVKMPRLKRLAERNRTRGRNMLFTTGLLVSSTLATFVLVVTLTTGL